MGAWLDAEWLDIKSLVMYGFGKQGRSYYKDLSKKFNIAAIIDNNTELTQMGGHDGIPVIASEDYFKRDSGCRIVIAAAGDAYRQIRNQLSKAGKKEGRDFIDADTFITLYGWQKHKKVCLGRVSLQVTECCNFNCEKCQLLKPFFKDVRHEELQELKDTADVFFAYVDSVSCLSIVGGETFLYPQLSEVVEYIVRKYGSRIERIMLPTNGTVMPDDKLLKVLSDNIGLAVVRISDYSTNLKGIHGRLKQFMEELKYDEWIDFGTPQEGISIGETKEDIRRHMLDCNGRCQTLTVGGKYYYCSRQRAAERAFGYEPEDGDVLDFFSLSREPSVKENIVLFHTGNMKKEYCSFCNVCRGYQSKKTVLAGIQKNK